MSYLTVKHVAISGMGVCIPSKIEENMTLPIWDDGWCFYEIYRY